ncbi:phage tail tube protein [Zhengella sp. ZM62]|uniref:phage tail tube protein n=1 Tax=Zhengella sedimenti TaxID=3390035 RepID=UPI003974DE03
MAQSHGSRHAISYVAESTFGTTPGSPTMLELRNTGTTLAVRKDNYVSEEIRSDRQIVDLRHGVKRADGEINFELSYGAFDDWLEAALFSTWSTNVLKAGTTSKSFTVERLFTDISEYQPFTGVMVNTMTLDIQPNAMVTGSFGVIGTGAMTPASSSLGSPTAAATNPPFDGFTGSITEGGSAANITSLSLELNNNLQPTYVIGSDTAPQIIYGQSVLTGTVEAWFETEALLNKFLNETESAIVLTLEGASGGDLEIDIPRIKYTTGDLNVQSANDGILVSLGFQAMRSSSDASNIVITRTPA